jgi:Predicted AAA-ATPase/PD-(D/E)XK nuclease superfamily
MNLLPKKLPIGIQSFAKIREGGFYYVDKTPFALRLVNSAGYCFLSRPRRFGKSLFLDTLKELFEGNQALFTGLAIHDHWDWSQRFPVLRLSFGGGVVEDKADLRQVVSQQLEEHERKFGLPARYADNRGRLRDLLNRLHEQTGQRVVVLVDEYDKPILDRMDDPDTARAIREELRNIYSVIKDQDAHIRFAMLTGVTKFSKVSLFSGLNNLEDITLDPRYSALCGYTDEDLDTVFAAELKGLDRARMRTWYNGYNWLGESVYNPFDLLLLFQQHKFKAWWFETGTPSFLLKLMAERGFFTPKLASLRTGEALISTFDIENLGIEALLFQSGYLTILSEEETVPGMIRYTLGYPNREVESCLNAGLLASYTGAAPQIDQHRADLADLLLAHDLAGLRDLFQSFYASIPHQWYTNNKIAHYEGFYASVFYSYFAALGFEVRVEDATNHGRIDMVVKLPERIFLFEFKVVELVPNGRALQQLKDKAYADKYKNDGLPIVLIGVEFSRESKNVVGFEFDNA